MPPRIYKMDLQAGLIVVSLLASFVSCQVDLRGEQKFKYNLGALRLSNPSFKSPKLPVLLFSLKKSRLMSQHEYIISRSCLFADFYLVAS